MRLWHYKLIPYLPKSQLISQWRELNSIFKKQDKHILINYIYNYPKSTLKTYSDLVIKEIRNRNYNVNKWDNYNEYFNGIKSDENIFNEHNNEYLLICFYNLKEKYLRGQNDFDNYRYDRIKNDLYRIMDREEK